MTGTFGWGVLERLQHPIARNLTASTITFVATIAVSVVLIVRWPGGAPLAVAIVGLFAAIAAATVVAMLLDRRNPYFRTREEVEEVLRLPVLAVCNSQHSTPNSQGTSGLLGVGSWRLGIDHKGRR